MAPEPVQQRFRRPHPARAFASYVPTPERSRANSKAAAIGSEHDAQMRKERANVEVRLANISIPGIAKYARNGYVVDIVSSFIVRELPMSHSTRVLAKKYIRWGQVEFMTGITDTTKWDRVDSGDPWQQWAYISRLPMADIGRDGRRRTLTHIDEDAEEKSWTVLLVPLRAWQADDLREELLAHPIKDADTRSRRQSLGSEIANSIRYPTDIL